MERFDSHQTDTANMGPGMAERALQIATALAAEVASLRERLAVVEQVAADKRLFSSAEIDSYQPDETTAAAFKAERIGLIGRVFGALRA